MLKFSIVFLFLLTVSAVKAQLEADKHLKELTIDLQKSKPDTNRLQILFQLSELYLKNPLQNKPGTDSPFLYLQQAVKLANSINSEKWEQKSLSHLGKYYFSKGDSKQGKACFLKIINGLSNSENKVAEIKWWLVLEKEIPHTDSIGITKIDCLKKIASLYDLLKNKEESILANLQIATTYMFKGNLNKSETEILNILDNNKPIPARCFHFAYLYLSFINRYKGNFEKSLYYSLECIKSIEKSGDTVRIDNYYGELAFVYQELGQIEKSIDWYQRTLEIRKKINQEPYVIYRTAGFLIQQLLKLKKEKEAFKVIANLAKDNPPLTAYERAILSQIKANYYKDLKQYGQAEKYYLEMISSKGFANENSEIATIAYQDIGEFYLNQKEFAKAEEYLTKSLETDDGGTTLSRIKDIHLLLFKVDSSKGAYLSAIRHFALHQQIKDSILNETKSKQIEEIQARYEIEKKEQNIKLLENESIIRESKLIQAKNTRNWILGGVALMLIIMGLLVNYLRLKQRTNKKLEAQQKLISQKNIALQHLVNEKEWLVKEIHHRVKNNFHIVTGLLGTQSEYLKTEEAIQAMTESKHRVHAMSLIHQKLYQSDNLSAINMPDYIHELVDYLRDSFNIRKSIHFSLEIEQIELDLVHCMPLGLIMNEAITNSIKYAFPGNEEGVVYISFKQVSENHLLLTIRDNGVGLSPDFNTLKRESMGMKLMRGLSEDIDGRFTINNHDGTEIMLDFNYHPDIHSGMTRTKTEPANSI